MFVVVTKENKLIRNFEDVKIACYEEISSAEHLAEIVNGKVYEVTEEELKIANKRRK